MVEIPKSNKPIHSKNIDRTANASEVEQRQQQPAVDQPEKLKEPPAPHAEASAVLQQDPDGENTTDVRLRGAKSVPTTRDVPLSDEQRQTLVKKNVTCPFLGSVVQQKELSVRNDAENPLAKIDDVVALGNSGGGDLGEVLRFFASGNHAKMLGADGKLSADAPPGMFSLILPGSQGSHAGNSGILKPQGRGTPGNGRLDEAAFNKLVAHAKDEWVPRSAIAAFIAENIKADPNSTGALKGAVLQGVDLLQAGGEALRHLTNKLLGRDAPAGNRGVLEELTELAGRNNLVGSAGEFGLLCALLANSPLTTIVDGEPAFAVSDLRSVFVDKKLPDGWQTWKKTRHDWIANTLALSAGAARASLQMKLGIDPHGD